MNKITRTFSILFAFGLLSAATSHAQLISLKTVPVATGDQFQLFPSTNAGMAGVSVALEDPLNDPFVNPALGARTRKGFLYTAPAYYGIQDTGSSGRSLPLGVLFSRENVFGGGMWSLQQLVSENTSAPWWGCTRCDLAVVDFLPQWEWQDFERESSERNTYLMGLLGFRMPESRSSVGFSVFRADLNAMEGVNLLYPRSENIDQSGSVTTFRIGLSGDMKDGRSYEAVGLLHKVDMRHDVTYRDWIWFEEEQEGRLVSRVDENLDKTDTWGVHFNYRQPIKANWKLGFGFTANWKDHPKIPNYEIMNIPRDPGNSTAYNFGVGLAREKRDGVFGLDVIFEPITSNTWVEAENDTQTSSGQTIAKGSRTIENDFTFSNLIVRTGFTRRSKHLDVQAGVQARNIYYDLEQQNFVEEFRRDLSENWTEWSVTAGLNVKFSDFSVRYTGQLTFGTGRPGLDDRIFWANEANFAADALSDIIVAPAGEIWLDETLVHSHQLSIIVPLEGR